MFSVMTTTRNEIIVEGSDDGVQWREYEFGYKPGDIKRAPPWNIPHQPRLDWQMWFAALDDAQRVPWFSRFLERLLENEPSVTGLLESFSRQAADLCARPVLRVHLCRKRPGGRPMVEPAIGGTLFPQGALEDRRRVKRPLALGDTWSSRNCKTLARV
jgi:Lipase maturation factor